MPAKCSALHCNTGYRCGTPKGISVHRFPLKDPDILCQWLVNINRRDFLPTQYSRICSLHFLPDDFIVESRDTNMSRKRGFRGIMLNIRRLKSTAVPTIFGEHLQKSLSKEKRNAVVKVKSTTISENLPNDQEELIPNAQINTLDTVENLDEIQSKLKSDELILPEFKMWILEAALNICYIKLNQSRIPFIVGGILIEENLDIRFSIGEKLINPNKYKHILKTGKVALISEVLKSIAFLKNLIELKNDDEFELAESSKKIDKTRKLRTPQKSSLLKRIIPKGRGKTAI